MKEQYVIKTRADEDEFLFYHETVEEWKFTQFFTSAYRFDKLEYARDALTQQCVVDSKYKVDIFKVVQTLEYIERGV